MRWGIGFVFFFSVFTINLSPSSGVVHNLDITCAKVFKFQIWATSWTCLCHMWTTKMQISLRIRAVWSASCYSLPRWYNTCTSSFYIRNFKPLASFLSWVGRFESYLIANPEDRFSCDVAHTYFVLQQIWCTIQGWEANYILLIFWR